MAATTEAPLDDLGDGIVVGAANRDGQVTISDSATGATLGRASGATAEALNADIAAKVGLIRVARAETAAVEAAAVEDMASGRAKLLAGLRSKATPTTTEVTEGPQNG